MRRVGSRRSWPPCRGPTRRGAGSWSTPRSCCRQSASATGREDTVHTTHTMAHTHRQVHLLSNGHGRDNTRAHIIIHFCVTLLYNLGQGRQSFGSTVFKCMKMTRAQNKMYLILYLITYCDPCPYTKQRRTIKHSIDSTLSAPVFHILLLSCFKGTSHTTVSQQSITQLCPSVK